MNFSFQQNKQLNNSQNTLLISPIVFLHKWWSAVAGQHLNPDPRG